MTTNHGYVKSVRVDRGFGFIACRSLDRDVFFHCTAIEPPLRFDETLEGLRVAFEIVENAKGPTARNVRAEA